MKQLGRVLRWGIGIAIGLYLAGALALNIPAAQRLVAGYVAEALEDVLHTEVGIGRIEVGATGRAVATDVWLNDQQGERLLEASRISARISLTSLIRGRVRLGNAGIFGLKANLYQLPGTEGGTNFQFVVEAFSSHDSTRHSPLYVRIGQLIVRRAAISWDDSDGRSLRLDSLNLTAELRTLTDDSLNLTLKRLDFVERVSGLRVREARLNARAGMGEAVLTDAHFALASSQLDIPNLSLSLGGSLPWTDLDVKALELKAEGMADSGDLGLLLRDGDEGEGSRGLLSLLRQRRERVTLEVEAGGELNSLSIRRLLLSDSALGLEASLKGNIYNLGGALASVLHSSPTDNGGEGNENGDLAQVEWEATLERSTLDTEALGELLNSQLPKRLGTVAINGNLRGGRGSMGGSLDIATSLGNVTLSAEASKESGIAEAEITTESFDVGGLTRGLTGELTGDIGGSKLGDMDLHLKATTETPKTEGGMRPLRLSGEVCRLAYNGYTYQNLILDMNLDLSPSSISRASGSLSLDDPNARLTARGEVNLRERAYKVMANVGAFNPHALGLTDGYEGSNFTGSLDIDLTGDVRKALEGHAYIDGFAMETPEDTYRTGDIHLTAANDGTSQSLHVVSPFLEATLRGEFELGSIVKDVKETIFAHIASVSGEEGEMAEGAMTAGGKETGEEEMTWVGERCALLAKVYSTEPLRRLLGVDLEVGSPVVVEAEVETGVGQIGLAARTRELRYGGERMRNVDVRVEGRGETLTASLRGERLMKGTYVSLGLDIGGMNNVVSTRLFWDNRGETGKGGTDKGNLAKVGGIPAMKGEVSMRTHLERDTLGNVVAESQILPSRITAGDSDWEMRAGAFWLRDGTLGVDSFRIEGEGHGLSIEGRASRDAADALVVRLQAVNLEDVFSPVNFHAVEMEGEATGEMRVRGILGKPYVETHFRVPDFVMNGAVLGDLDMRGNWGEREYSIYMDGHIAGYGGRKDTRVHGFVTPKTDVPYHGIDLAIEADSLSIGFLNKYTEAIFDRMEGHATGYAHLFGPFKRLDIEGGLLVHEGSMGVPLTGVRYGVVNDSVCLSPGIIRFTDADIFDPSGRPSSPGHRAKLNGLLRHTNFSNLSYDIGIRGERLLVYDFKETGDLPFCGTVWATGDVNISGTPGNVGIDIKVQPQRGTTFTYDYTSPENVTDNALVTYIDRNKGDETSPTSDDSPKEEVVPENDIRINFDLDIDEASTLNLLMDSRSGDMIKVNGRGHMLARYYNKGDFQLYGTYRVERGTYNLSLQEIIHKDFSLTEGGTIVFTGNPEEADLNVQASHTVTGVSLNDISARSTFSNTSARVNCLMNITGKASQPRVSFDFDILNVNEDEKQMVRSLISTEEERNMQVIYLLGIGRFYTYDYTNTQQSQSSTAVNSLLSSTLSGQLNQLLSNMIGSSKWSVGTNLNTGEEGWSDIDVEGMLQGSLLNDRLLVNGNFGYRDNPVSSSNFIGDFDMQYRLTKSGSVNLKAYNKTNDRYFTKSSLTTQGVGILLKKDFSSPRDLFRRGRSSR